MVRLIEVQLSSGLVAKLSLGNGYLSVYGWMTNVSYPLVHHFSYTSC